MPSIGQHQPCGHSETAATDVFSQTRGASRSRGHPSPPTKGRAVGLGFERQLPETTSKLRRGLGHVRGGERPSVASRNRQRARILGRRSQTAAAAATPPQRERQERAFGDPVRTPRVWWPRYRLWGARPLSHCGRTRELHRRSIQGVRISPPENLRTFPPNLSAGHRLDVVTPRSALRSAWGSGHNA